jgi:hypothetical protein
MRCFRSVPGRTAFDCLLVCLTLGLNSNALAQPELVSGPTTETVLAQGGKMTFNFDEIMDASDIHVEWQGTGIDASRFSCQWVDEIFGIPIPATFFECTYTGGLPGGIQLTYVLNPGNSGRIKSFIGEALPETTGSFTTPGTGGGDPCDPPGEDTSSAVITLVKDINYIQTAQATPVFDPAEKAVLTAAVLSGTNRPPTEPTSASLQKPDGTLLPLAEIGFEIPDLPDLPLPGLAGIAGFPIPDFSPSFFLSTAEPPEIEFPTFESEAALEAAFPAGAYRMIIGLEGGGNVTVNLPLDPGQEVPVPMVGNYQALQSFDPAQPLTIQWTPFTGAGQDDGITLQIREKDGPNVFFAPNPCEMIELNPGDTSITLPAGTLAAEKTYQMELTFARRTHTGEDTLETYAEFAAINKTTRLTMGAPDAGPGTARLARLRLEETGAVLLTVEGTINSDLAATIEGSTDLKAWETVTAITRAALEQGGGMLEVGDIAPAITPAPHKFYRIRFN